MHPSTMCTSISLYMGDFLIWVPENEPLKQPLKQTSETHPLKQPLKQGHSWLKKLEKQTVVGQKLEGHFGGEGGCPLKHP